MVWIVLDLRPYKVIQLTYLFGANVGDIVTYRMIGFDYQGLSSRSYEFKMGTPDHVLYVKGNAEVIFDDYIESTY